MNLCSYVHDFLLQASFYRVFVTHLQVDHMIPRREEKCSDLIHFLFHLGRNENEMILFVITSDYTLH